MKMSKKSYNYIVTIFKDNLEVIKEHAEQVKASGKYKDFGTRVGWDALRYATRQDGYKTFIQDILYYAEDLNDNHITTGVKRALKEVGITE